MLAYETQREFFNSIAKMYKDYLRLYKFFNNGSLDGCTDFAKFYWIHSYHYRSSNLLNELGVVR